jgi:hypothetical protein
MYAARCSQRERAMKNEGAAPFSTFFCLPWNLVTVSYSFTTGKGERALERTVTRVYAPVELAEKAALYREKERSFAVGDRIVALKNDRRLKLQNGSLGIIRELGEDGVARVDLGDRETVLDLNRYRQIDQAYAVTIHKSQGATLEHSILFAQARPEEQTPPAKNLERELGPEVEGRNFCADGGIGEQTRRLKNISREMGGSFDGLQRAAESLGKFRVREIKRSLREIPMTVKDLLRRPELPVPKKAIEMELKM